MDDKELPIIDEMAGVVVEQGTTDAEIAKRRATTLHPLTDDMALYKDSLLDGTRPFRGLATNLPALDKMIGGLDHFVLLAGRSGAGKTTLALQLANGVVDGGVPVIIYSFEMGRNEIITKLLQSRLNPTLPREQQLYRNTIELHGNDKNLDAQKARNLDDGLQRLSRTGERFYIRDAEAGIPSILDPTAGSNDIPTMLQDIQDVQAKNNSADVLVVIDSVQDIVTTYTGDQTKAEVKAVNDLAELQQRTGATLLVTAQKNKSSINSLDSYGDVMGSMSFIHKPYTVMQLLTPRELLPRFKGDDSVRDGVEQLEQESKRGGAKPMLISLTKSRYTALDSLLVQYYGASGYFVDNENNPNYSDIIEKLKSVL